MVEYARKKYQEFQGKKPSKVRSVQLPDLSKLVYLGKAESIGYRCSKRNGAPSDRAGKLTSYLHDFEGNISLCCSSDGKALVLFGPGLRVLESGING